MARQKDGRLALRGLWALHAAGGFDETFAAEMVEHTGEYVRAWTIRLLGDAKSVSAETANRFADLAEKDPSPVVRAQLASTAKRLSGAAALPILEQLILRDADAADPVVSWLIWWAIESKAISDRDGLLRFFAPVSQEARRRLERRKGSLFRANLARLVRRYAAEGTAAGYGAAYRLIGNRPVIKEKPPFEDLDRGLAERSVGLPPVGQGGLFDKLAVPDSEPTQPARKYEPLTPDLEQLIHSAWAESRTSELTTRLALRAGNGDARQRVHADIADPMTSRQFLLERLAVLEELGDATCIPVVKPHLRSSDAEVQRRALAVLGRHGGAAIGDEIVKAYPGMPDANRSRARELLFSRRDWARSFLALIDDGKVPASEIPVEQVRLLAVLEDPQIDAAIRKHWGNIKPGTPEEKLAAVRRFNNDLRAGTGDAVRGKALFAKHCGVCHKLFGDGGSVGPDLTNTSRTDTAALLANIVDPGAVVRAEYVQYAVRTADDVVRTGIIADQDGASVTLVDAKGEKMRIARDRIDSLRELTVSLMPEKLLDALTLQERRDLFRYLQSPGK
jgi:putative heme-binding domain-containing protein